MKYKDIFFIIWLSFVLLYPNNNRGDVMNDMPAKPKGAIRIATFNASLNRMESSDLGKDLHSGQNRQIQNIAQIIQNVNPDILLINEFDYDPRGQYYVLFQENYLKKTWQHSANTIDFPYYFTAPSNTGVPSGFDLDHNDKTNEPNDALGFGTFPGQYGMAVYSKLPIATKNVRTFQNFLWKDMPNALLPDNPQTTKANDWYGNEILDIFPLSSKSHWDIPIQINGKTIHILASHPTPPVFDGPEDRNGKRNHDEVRFWVDYITPDQASYIYDDQKKKGGLGDKDYFIVMGDLNADPADGDGHHEAIQNLLHHPRVQSSPIPKSIGAVEASQRQGKDNKIHSGNAAYDTADFSEPPGNLRADYILPSKNMKIMQSGVFWPSSKSPLRSLVHNVKTSSDHRLVWADVIVE